jgi:hypothetical protein
MNFICQTASEMRDIRANIRRAAKAGACAVYHHGIETGNYIKPTHGVVVGMFPKHKDIVRENVKIVKALTKNSPRVTNL